MTNINWDIIAKAVSYYQSLGFKYIETPWHVDHEVAMVTCPHTNNLIDVDRARVKNNNRMIKQSLVGSAEQGFLQLLQNGELDAVNYVSAGPCFRREHVYDDLHQPQFFKVEVFVKCSDSKQAQFAANELIFKAKKFMQDQSGQAIEVVDSGHGWDLELNGVELGSYGYRCAQGYGCWAYGTGVAEPRFSTVVSGL